MAKLVSLTLNGTTYDSFPTDAGLTTAQVNALDGLFKIAAYTKDASAEYAAFATAFGLSGGGTDEPDEPVNPEVTLSSISATYSGGSVPAGTALNDLTGIVVTAHYSDGSTATVTGYTLSGTIAEGSNTVTVTYQGMTTTITVTGTVVVVYTVTNNLTNVTNSNSQTEVTEGFYSATLTVVDGYTMQSVAITMGGVDITADVYGDGGILITEVTGDIVITAVAGLALAYALPEPLTFAGTGNAEYDTGYTMYPDGDKDISVCVDFSNSASSWGNIDVIHSNATYGYRLWHNGARIYRINSCNGDYVTEIQLPFEHARIVFVKTKGTGDAGVYALKDGAVKKYETTVWANGPEASDATVKIGTTETAWMGTFHDFRVYDQLLSDAQIEAYLNGGDI